MATIHDLVLAHIDNKPAFYARIEEITPDVKPGWWKVKLLVLGSTSVLLDDISLRPVKVPNRESAVSQSPDSRNFLIWFYT